MLSCRIFETTWNHLRTQIAADDVAAERKRQTGGVIGPPLAEVDDLPEALLGVGQLPLVNEQPGVRLAVEDHLLDLVERHDGELEARLVQPQRQVRRGERAWYRDPRSFDPCHAAFPRDHDRPIVVAHAGAVGQQRVLVEQVGVRVKRDRRHFVPSFERGPIQGLDVRQNLIDNEAVGIDGAAREAVEHERVVGIRTMGDGDSRV